MEKLELITQMLKLYEAQVKDFINYAEKDIERFKENEYIKSTAQMMKTQNEMSLTRIKSLLEICEEKNNEFISSIKGNGRNVLQIGRKC